MTMLSEGEFHIIAGERLLNPVHNLLISVCCFSYASLIASHGHLPQGHINYQFNCKLFDFDIWVPVGGVIEHFISGGECKSISLLLSKKINGPQHIKPYGRGIIRADIKSVMFNYVSSCFVIFYEKQADWINENLGKDVKDWPDLMNFCRTIRNAIVHDGVITIKNFHTKPVMWKSLTYTAADNGKLLSDNILEGDILGLMLELNQLMNDLDAPHRPAGE